MNKAIYSKGRILWMLFMVWAAGLWAFMVQGETREYPLSGGTYALGTTTYTVAVPDEFYLDQVSLRLAIQATEPGTVDDLEVSLVSPLGTTVKVLLSTLLGDDDGSLEGTQLQDTLFAESGTDSIESGVAPYAGTFRVDNWSATTGLARFRNQRSSGNWTLKIRDTVGAGGTVFGSNNKAQAAWTSLGSALVFTPVAAGLQPPSLTPESDSGVSQKDNITRIASPTLTGTAAAGSSVKVLLEGTPPVELGTTTVSSTGIWTLTVPAPLAGGTHSIYAEITPPNESSVQTTASVSVTIDVTAPSLTAIADVEMDEGKESDPSLFVVSDNLSPAASLQVSGTVSPGSLLSEIVSGGVGAARNVVLRSATGQSGEGEVTVVVTDEAGNTGQQVFKVTVTASNKAPVPGPDTLNRSQGGRVAKILISTLLANDTDADGDTLSLDSVRNALPTGSTVEIMEPYVVYTVPAGTVGSGSFEYMVSDGLGGHLVAGTASVTESAAVGQDDPALPIDAKVEGVDMLFTWLGVPRRNYKVQYTTSTAPPYVWVDFSPAAVYTAARTNVLGVFQHRDVAPSESMRLYRALPMGWDNEPPVLVADSADRSSTARELSITTQSLLANDSDPDQDTLTIVAVGNALPEGATVVLSDSEIIYMAPASNEGPGSFTYQVSDGLGGHRVTATVTVRKVDNKPPVVVADSVDRSSTARELSITTQSLLANDSDPDQDTLTIVAVGDALPEGATVVLSDSEIIYTAPAGNEGPGSFSYQVSDGPGGHSVTATVTVRIVETSAP